MGPEAWKRLRVWEVLLGIAVVVPALHILWYGTAPVWQAVVIGCLLAIPAAYLLLGRRAILAEDTRRGTWYAAVLVVLYVPIALISDVALFVLFGVCPQVFMAVPARRGVVVAVLLAAPNAVRLGLTEPDVAGLFSLVMMLTTTVFFSSAFGMWGERVVRQSAERAELIRRLAASHAEVARLSAERGALAERERLAGEIHDTLAQGFSGIIMLLQAAQAQPDPSRHLELAIRTAKENLAEARALVAALRPAPLDGSTLGAALRRITERFGEETGVAAAFATRGTGRALPPQYEVVLIRAAQEALSNVRKHAAATRVEVALEYGPAEVTLRVRDDGRGFGGHRPGPASGDAADHADVLSAGYGLRAMRARVEQAHGTLTVADAESGGAELTVRLPLPPETPAPVPPATVPAARPSTDPLPEEV
ncbi:two-component sensor histidine kinase [Thermopolyspora flexuosa]|jgi:signal transduction histidine kinase|nr:two-component sensor histidine kinase [Thermopolyspora flexuosa]